MRFSSVAIAGAGLLAFCSAAHAGDKVWISLGDAALAQLQKHTAVAVTARVQADVGDPTRAATAGGVEGVHLVQVDEDDLAKLSESVHTELRRCGGYMYHASQAEGLTTLQRLSGAARPATLAAATRPSYIIDQQSLVTPMLSQMQASTIGQTILDLSGHVNRHYQTAAGVNASDWLKQRWSALANGRRDITVEQFKHPNWKQKSVIATIRGTDNPDEVVVLGGHLDSINQAGTSETTRAPGADDDASGVASLTEVFRTLVANGYQPRRTLKFMAYAAEEVGLRGSQEIARSHANAGINVVGVMQLDMTNYKGSADDIYIFTDYTDAQQNAFVTNLIRTYLPTLNIGSDRCGYGCSDHASWNAQGYAASMPFEAAMNQSNPHIHTADDTYANTGSMAEHSLKFARMALAYMVELGSDGPGLPDKVETFNGSLARNQTRSFGPFRSTAGSTFKASTTGTGDIDLYAKRGTPPTTSSHDCKSDGSTATESCSVEVGADGEVYVVLKGYTAGSYDLTVSYRPQ
ncbi:M20/M25/M40 family metallo-hydrolase [Aquabacterium sp. A7-Y]|uniref:M20/M25/M40 family metallo-hydrolase n=1 Tax=Aquabacterium sp. A7-Y TaxID=1349605 RepID=UPI00223DA1D0|nr:M20/M25/M40 family metallo-hydrolase [Aquabacterium sp. A7-Y]MCW7538240.1 M20/M25/M40 family metallo-hydrolase [Aquabacterium sp. A7-Y]